MRKELPSLESSMSKHDVITDNLTALTRSRSFDKAVKGWVVMSLVALLPDDAQSCELCGTRFRQGARVQHRNTDATILVGGTCLKTLQRHRFPPRFKFREARELTFNTLSRLYGPLVHPGNWIRWIVENAPRRLAQSVADLRSFGAVLHLSELDALIRFHDRRRLFTRNALLGDARLLESRLGMKIASHITIDQAKRIQGKAETQPPAPVSVYSAEYAKRVVRLYINDDPELAVVWRGLTSVEKRAITALAALDEHARKEGAALCPDALAATWPPAQETGPMIVWNARIGLGFVGPDDTLDGQKAHVWLWRSRRYRRKTYDLQYWHGIVGCSLEVVQDMEELAFQGRMAESLGLTS
ncbi:MAG: hypothetical protein ACLQOO_06120 [Terriglobia bacterium]